MNESKAYEAEAQARLRELLARVPSLTVGPAEIEPPARSHGAYRPDFVLPVDAGGQQWRLVCEVKVRAQPRQVRMTVLALKDYLSRLAKPDHYPVLLAPYLSPESAAICLEAGAGFADFAGNCYLSYGTVFIERSGAANPNVEKRSLRSFFASKSARILRALLRAPDRGWRVTELAAATGTSLGQVSNVRRALIEQEWAAVGSEGLKLTQPGALLDAWRDDNARRRATRTRYYTLLHGAPLEQQIRLALDAAGQGAHAVLASYSAARWLAPYARYPTQLFYADEMGEKALRDHLKLEPASKGENVVIERPVDAGIFDDRVEAAPGLWTTGVIQTYLDLSAAGERGREAADHLRKMRIEPQWKQAA
jgi:hypothetical protein